MASLLNHARRPAFVLAALAAPLLLGAGLQAGEAQRLPQQEASRLAAREDRTLEITPRAKRAIERGLDFLASRQDADGSWKGPMGRNTGVASFAVLSFLSTGAVPGRGNRGRIAARGVDYILQHAQWNGLISNPAQTSGNGPMYEHAMSTLLLAEVWGAYLRPGLHDALQRSVQLIISSQNDQGGWRYEPRPADADVSVTVMQLVALRAAKNAGISVPRRVFDAAVRYVKSCAKPSGGFLYQPGVGQEGYARTAAGVCSLLVGGDTESPEVTGGLRYLQERKARQVRGDEHLHYALYYAAQAMYQAPDPKDWFSWYSVARDELLSLQESDGHWEGEAGPIYGTAFAILALSVPYRYLPVYQH
jgi:hypothetical protein